MTERERERERERGRQREREMDDKKTDAGSYNKKGGCGYMTTLRPVCLESMVLGF